MNTKTLTAGALTGLLVMSLTLGPVAAQTAATTTGLSEADAVAIALGEVPGEVQEVELETEEGQEVYEIEILTAEGVEMEIEIAAASGDVLEIEADDANDDDNDDDCDDKDEA